MVHDILLSKEYYVNSLAEMYRVRYSKLHETSRGQIWNFLDFANEIVKRGAPYLAF